MSDFYKEAINRLDELYYVQREIEKFLKKAPDGFVQTEMRKGRAYYFWNKMDHTGVRPLYIKKGDFELAQALGTKSYYLNLIKDINKEIKLLERCINIDREQKKEQNYENLSAARKELVRPFFEYPKTKIKRWENEEFETKGIAEGTTTFETNRGEKVRSKSEKIIADALLHRHIPYKYECPLQLNGVSFPIYPDFSVINKRTAKVYLWEHLGMMDSPEYYENAMNRLAQYASNGIFIGENLIISFETLRNPISTEMINHYIDEYLM